MKMFFCGDVVITGDYSSICDPSLAEIISSCDIAICNFEAPIVSNGEAEPILKVGPHLKQNKQSLKLCREAGFNVFSLANNHIYDFGQVGVDETVEEILSSGGEYLGVFNDSEDAYKIKIYESEGTKIGMIAVGETEFGVRDGSGKGYANINDKRLDESIKEAAAAIDFLVVIAHTGVEKIHLPLPEWRNRYRELCDLGADLVVGHHPHVPQGYENYKKSVIYYSLGNFFFDTAGYNKVDNSTFSLLVNFDKDGLGVEHIFHHQPEGVTRLISEEDSSFDLEKLNYDLGDKYEETIAEIVCSLYTERYKPYYRYSFLGLPDKMNIYELGKVIFKWCFLFNKTLAHRELLLYHNLKVDSHRYVVQRYLKGKYKL